MAFPRTFNRNSYDEARAEAFAERMVSVLNDGALCLMVSVGHRTGLFDAMAEQPPSTSGRIAEAAGLEERYVREWLDAMTVARVVDHEAATGRYRLPAEHAASLTRGTKADNIGVFAQYIGLLGGVEDDIVQCFREGGGVPYARYPRFHEVLGIARGLSPARTSPRFPFRRPTGSAPSRRSVPGASEPTGCGPPRAGRLRTDCAAAIAGGRAGASAGLPAEAPRS